MSRRPFPPSSFGAHLTITTLLADTRIRELHRAAANARLAAEARPRNAPRPARVRWGPLRWRTPEPVRIDR
ncbi:MAG: hypothetical protein ACYDHH_18210 [Solirubrobacteraceae bacterium]